MKAYLIPRENKLRGMLITEVGSPVPRTIVWPVILTEGCFLNLGRPTSREFVLETITDIAVYKEKEVQGEAPLD